MTMALILDEDREESFCSSAACRTHSACPLTRGIHGENADLSGLIYGDILAVYVHPI